MEMWTGAGEGEGGADGREADGSMGRSEGYNYQANKLNNKLISKFSRFFFY